MVSSMESVANMKANTFAFVETETSTFPELNKLTFLVVHVASIRGFCSIHQQLLKL